MILCRPVKHKNKTLFSIFLESLDRNRRGKRGQDKSDNFGEEGFGPMYNLTV